MKKLFYSLLYEIENYKIYHIIIIFTVAFIIIFFNSFYYIRQELETIANQNRVLASKEIEYTISLWFNERINTLESGVSYLNKQNILQNEQAFKAFIEVTLNSNHDFDLIQALFPHYYIYFNSTKVHDYRENPIYIYEPTKQDPLKLAWYVKTKETLKTTITAVKKHVDLLEQAMLICSPVIQQEQFEGVLCGTFKTRYLFEKINTLSFPENTYYFISDAQGNILSTGSKFEYLKEKLENILKPRLQSNMEVKNLITEKDTLTLTKLKDFDWYIGVGIQKESIMDESVGRVTSQAIFLFLAFILLIIISNTAHTFLQRRIERKQKEYEYMLAHRSRISEVGKLVVSINHQLKQPLNALALIISTTLDLFQRKQLEPDILESNLALCQKSITLMDKTIGMFRNFYRCNEEIVEFSLIESIQNVLHVNYTELSRHNITVIIKPVHDISFTVRSHENYIQQILLVLIQNAKDALISHSKLTQKGMQQIYLYLQAENEKIYIDIEDWGGGISKDMENVLFSEFKISKKYNGSGIGLYFAHKLACEKLKGDLALIRCSSPTKFRFSFAQYLS